MRTLALVLLLCCTACNSTSAPTPTQSATAQPAANVQPGASDASNVSNASNASNVNLELDPEHSQALFRAREQLANRSLPSDAVGTTKDVAGAIAVSADGIVPANSSVTVKLESLQSDSRQRDNFIKQNTLEVARYPTAQFQPTALHGLSWPLPESGTSTFQIDGDLTVHGVTRPTTWDLNGTFSSDDVSGSGTTVVTLDQFGMQKPRVFSVLSIDDDITLELDFRAVRTPAR
ncbi:MAG: YceI family protein [Chloroflexi bacterium]|nr:YceI family protein [Chloroflexota bacterium]